MNIESTLKIIKKYSKCAICGDETIGNGSKLNIDDKEFTRTCRECGWKVQGVVSDEGEVVEIYNNAN